MCTRDKITSSHFGLVIILVIWNHKTSSVASSLPVPGAAQQSALQVTNAPAKSSNQHPAPVRFWLGVCVCERGCSSSRDAEETTPISTAQPASEWSERSVEAQRDAARAWRTVCAELERYRPVSESRHANQRRRWHDEPRRRWGRNHLVDGEKEEASRRWCGSALWLCYHPCRRPHTTHHVSGLRHKRGWRA